MADGAVAHGLGAALLLPGVLHACEAGGFAAAELPARVLLALWAGGEASVLAFACLGLIASALLGGGTLLWLLFRPSLFAVKLVLREALSKRRALNLRLR